MGPALRTVGRRKVPEVPLSAFLMERMDSFLSLHFISKAWQQENNNKPKTNKNKRKKKIKQTEPKEWLFLETGFSGCC